MIEHITSRQNQLMAHLRRLASSRSYRRSQGEYVADGVKLLEEAIRWEAPLTLVVTTPECGVTLPDGVRHVSVPPELMAYISPLETPQGVLFTVKHKDFTGIGVENGQRYLVLDGLQDPGNVGTIWRTADALEADGLFLLNHCADPYNPKTIRATMGAVFRLPVWETELSALQGFLAGVGIPLYGTALRDDTVPLGTVPLGKSAVVIGSEGGGISPEILALCEKTLKIPMAARCESLNAAAAATIVLWEMAQS